jgi:hypothetical protein
MKQKWKIYKYWLLDHCFVFEWISGPSSNSFFINIQLYKTVTLE